MTIDSKALIKGKIEIVDMIKLVNRKFDKDAIGTIKVDENEDMEMCRIGLNYKDEDRILTVMNCPEAWSGDAEVKELRGSESTYLRMSYGGDSTEILTTILNEYGGWLDYNDCDDEDYVYIEKNNR